MVTIAVQDGKITKGLEPENLLTKLDFSDEQPES
jgi:hypothetical protein